MRKVIFIIFLLLMVSVKRVIAPDLPTPAYIPMPTSINPYTGIKFAVGKVEVGKTKTFWIGEVKISMQYMDTTAINQEEKAYGYFQVRQIRLNDYNEENGTNYTLEDMLVYEKAEKVFMYYAIKIGYENPGLIARSWNGSGPKTWDYWNKVKIYLII